eukprot:5100082-Prymnesium_polylepis.1
MRRGVAPFTATHRNRFRGARVVAPLIPRGARGAGSGHAGGGGCLLERGRERVDAADGGGGGGGGRRVRRPRVITTCGPCDHAT